MNPKRRWMALVAGVLALGLIAGGAAMAAEGDVPATTQTPAQQSRKPQLSEAEKAVLQQLRDLHKSYMEKLKAESEALIDKAVAGGTLTQEQADRLKARAGKPGKGPRMGPRHGKHPHGPGMMPGGPGMGMHRPGLGKLLTAEEVKAKLDEAVSSGRLSQEQAEAMLQRWTERQTRRQQQPAPSN